MLIVQYLQNIDGILINPLSFHNTGQALNCTEHSDVSVIDRFLDKSQNRTDTS